MRTLSGLSGVVSSWRLLLTLLVAGTATIASVQDSSAQEQQRPRRPQAQQSEQQPAEQRQGESRGSVLRLLPADSVTEHSVDIPGGKLAYTATAGTLALYDQSGERSAAFTDLVMIDPVGTGWSRPAKADGDKAFYSVRADAQAVAKTIALYLAKNGRGSSAKYLLGESYGGFRAPKVAQALRHDQSIAVSGIIMLSPLVEGNLLFDGNRFALGAALHLPSLAATELERKGTFSKEALADAERFALTDYLTTLAGPTPKGDAARSFYARVAQITGLPEDVVTRARGFIRDDYIKHLRSTEGKIVSRYDATLAVPDPFPEQETAWSSDPLLDGLTRAYGGLYASYARDELGFKTEMTYVLLSSDISGKWDWGSSGRGGASVNADLRELLAINPSLRVMIAHGYSDMVTPYSVSRYMLDHLPAMGDLARAQLKLYRGGHMFYIDADSRKAFTADAKAFYQSVQ